MIFVMAGVGWGLVICGLCWGGIIIHVLILMVFSLSLSISHSTLKEIVSFEGHYQRFEILRTLSCMTLRHDGTLKGFL